MFEIEKNVPIPPPRAAHRKYNFDQMEVGDSIFVTGKSPNTVQTSARGFGERHKMRFTVRKLATGIRVWRIE